MAKLILLRHLKSQWNLENRFTGWVDVPLSKGGAKKEKDIAKKLAKFKIDIIYSSPLIRNEDTVVRVLEEINKKYPIFLHFKGKMKDWGHFTAINKNYFPVYVSENLNERYYGKLQGLNKAQIIKKYGSEKVHLWRRGFLQRPPGGESLKDTFKRAVPFYQRYIKQDLRRGKTVLIVASHNSLRAIIKYIERISDKDIISLEIPYGGLIECEFDKSLKLKGKKILQKGK